LYLFLFASLSKSVPACTPEVHSGLNVLLISIDTLRADRLACYGYDRIDTPNIDAMARRGVLFGQAVTQVPITLPAHCSLMTGLNPTVHNVKDNGTFRLDPSETTLAEVLKENGLETAAFVGAFPMDSRFGLDQGFDLYDDDMNTPNAIRPRFGPAVWKNQTVATFERRGVDVVSAAGKWMSSNRSRRFFAFVHLFDPHIPYYPPPPFLQDYRGRLYDGEVAYTDYCLGLLFRQMELLGIMDQTLIVITSDHGESLGEHEYYGHGKNLYEPGLPLIIVCPALLPENKRVDSLVRSIDVMPTVLDFLGLKPPPGIDGQSLWPLLLEERSSSPGVLSYGETFYLKLRSKEAEVRSIRSDRWKYIRYSKGRRTIKEELFDLESDPGEVRSLSGPERPELLEMSRVLNKILEADKNRSKNKKNTLKLDKETKEKLRSLGYIK
jgi:arylsulfatase A-like enzyme